MRDVLLEFRADTVVVHDGEPRVLDVAHLPQLVASLDDGHVSDVRWVWDSTALRYDALLRAGVRVTRCHDLFLAHRILAGTALLARDSPDTGAGADPAWSHWDGGQAPVAAGAGAPVPSEWRESREARHEGGEPADDALFAVGPPADATPEPSRDVVAEWTRQRRILESVTGSVRHRLRLLLAVECSGALAAVELRHDGLPFRRDLHEATLARLLGERPRPMAGHPVRPRLLEELAGEIRDRLDAPRLNPDSQPHLLRELRRNGLDVESTNRWELARQEHPVVEPLLRYKSLARLASANGWAWLDAWVSDGRFRSDYVPAGVVTGRWSSRGGGALSLPKVIRGAVRADPGWRLVVVDAAQLEPRMLAAMAADQAMLRAGAAGDLYQGLVDAGVVDTRAHAKVGMLAVLYGSTSGQSVLLLPRLARAYPRAMHLVDDAARVGEAGGIVTTWLGRSSPPPSAAWRETQQAASDADAGAAAESRARSRARDWGRFTRNFVVQGTAAEWALAWLAGVRLGLRALGRVEPPDRPDRRGVGPDGEPHLAFFLHDELVVHTPAALVPDVERVLRESAAQASRLLFGHLPEPAALAEPSGLAGPAGPSTSDDGGWGSLVPLDVVVAESYDEVDGGAEEALAEASDVVVPSRAEALGGEPTD